MKTSTAGSTKQYTSEAVYSKNFLRVYDQFVLGLANYFAWNCPTKLQLDFYNRFVSKKHLDVGPGTGYFLDKCKFPTTNPEIHLLDLNRNCLTFATKRIRRYQPVQHDANVLEPLKADLPIFNSIALKNLLHCLDGTMDNKEKVFKHLIPHLAEEGVLFGSTVLGSEIKVNPLGKRWMKFLNAKGIFSNTKDSLLALESILNKNFANYTVKVVGCVALFAARKK